MKYWRVEARDCAGECVGAFSFDNHDAALQCLQWYDSHPLPENEYLYHVLVEIEPKLDHYFIPPMSEEEYSERIAEARRYGYEL